MLSIDDEIRQRLQNKNLKMIAEQIGVQGATLGRFLNQKKPVKMSTLSALIDFFRQYDAEPDFREKMKYWHMLPLAKLIGYDYVYLTHFKRGKITSPRVEKRVREFFEKN